MQSLALGTKSHNVENDKVARYLDIYNAMRKIISRKFSRVLAIVLSSILLSSCATTKQQADVLERPLPTSWQVMNTNNPQVSAGSLEVFSVSGQLPETQALIQNRRILVWLPPNYPKARRYAVLYMLDGQMLFDSSQTWNHQEWGVDETAAALQDATKDDDNSVTPFIVVGIDNAGAARHSEYFPQQPFANLTPEQQAQQMASKRGNEAMYAKAVYSDAFLRFVVAELKPAIDALYQTKQNPEHTFIAGSSMGGLLSCYALLRYPQTFGGAACMSTHWPGADPALGPSAFEQIASFFKANLPKPAKHKFWFDLGDQTLDALYPPLQGQIDQYMQQAGYDKFPNLWQTKYDPGAEHNETAWRKRLPQALRFLFSAPSL